MENPDAVTFLQPNNRLYCHQYQYWYRVPGIRYRQICVGDVVSTANNPCFIRGGRLHNLQSEAKSEGLQSQSKSTWYYGMV
jgi:hypothetical protein